MTAVLEPWDAMMGAEFTGNQPAVKRLKCERPGGTLTRFLSGEDCLLPEMGAWGHVPGVLCTESGLRVCSTPRTGLEYGREKKERKRQF
jgi:hypothetical protein